MLLDVEGHPLLADVAPEGRDQEADGEGDQRDVREGPEGLRAGDRQLPARAAAPTRALRQRAVRGDARPDPVPREPSVTHGAEGHAGEHPVGAPGGVRGGGPGVGPIGVAKHLVPFLPSGANIEHRPSNIDHRVGPVAAAPWGSASILTITWMYIRMMGPAGLKRASEVAILNANYIAKRLDPYFPVLFKGKHGLVAHECIVDLRQWRSAGIEVEDVAKRLMDYGFHAPTVSWPVGGTMMIEPTESEPKHELDRFCDAMISIHAEMQAIADGKQDRQSNLLKNAPHTARQIASDKWDRPYSREQAAFPAPWTRDHKFWPAVGRIDNVYGDRNLFCSCPPVEEFEKG